MPKLAQLRLVSVADMGENDTFRGVPYYSFGDVVMDKDDCYWICVRPAYSPNGKEDTHWMSFQLSEKNVKIYQKKGCKEQRYPANLGVQKEKMQYLAQLMAILANPYGYKAAAPNGKFFKNKTTGLGSLRDDAMPADTLIAQAQLWEKLDIWKRIIPNRVMPTIQDVDNFKNRFKKNLFSVEVSNYSDELVQNLASQPYEICSQEQNRYYTRFEIKIPEVSTPNALLQFFSQYADIHSFNEIMPTMNEIFIEQVEQANQQQSHEE
jgi:hypothetical protein